MSSLIQIGKFLESLNLKRELWGEKIKRRLMQRSSIKTFLSFIDLCSSIEYTNSTEDL